MYCRAAGLRERRFVGYGRRFGGQLLRQRLAGYLLQLVVSYRHHVLFRRVRVVVPGAAS